MASFQFGMLVEQVATTATAAGTTTLTNTSKQIQYFTGSTTQTVKLPPTTSMVIGQFFEIFNGSTGALTMQYQDASSFTGAPTVAAGSSLIVKLVSVSSTNGTWISIVPSAAATVTASNELLNLGLASSVGSNLLTVRLKQSDGSTDPASGTGAVKITFRDSTLANGQYFERSITSALSINTVATGATLGTVSAQNQYIFVYAIDNAGTVELALAGNQVFDEGQRYSTTAIGSGSTDGQTLYSTTARSNVAVRLIGRLKVNETTAGTYASAATEIALLPLVANKAPRSEVSVNTYSSKASTNGSIVRFATTRVNIGTAITYAQSATLGDTFTINEDGIYYMMFTNANRDGVRGPAGAISKNSTGFNDPAGEGNTTRMSWFDLENAPAANDVACCTYTGFLKVGDVIRAHAINADLPSTAASTMFTICKISD